MRYTVAPVPSQADQLAAYLRRELQRVANAIDYLEPDGWDDLRFPPSSIDRIGILTAPTLDEATGANDVTGTLLFSGTAENIVAGVAQLPHGWRVGTELKPHLHWSKPTGSSAAVTWQLYYKILGNPADTAQAWVGPVTGTIAVGDPTVSNQQMITSFGLIDLTGYYESAMLAWRLHRMGNTDAEANAVRLLEFDFHYRRARLGSPKDIPT